MGIEKRRHASEQMPQTQKTGLLGLLGFADPIETADAKIMDLSLRIQPKDRSYYYDITNPFDPEAVKKKDGRKVSMKSREKRKVLARAKREMDALIAERSRGGVKDELAGIPLTEWERAINRNLRTVIGKAIDAGARREERDGLRKKFKDITWTQFESSKPELDIYKNLGDISEEDRQLQALNAGMRMMVFVQNMTLKDLDLGNDIIGGAFFHNARERLKPKNPT